MNPRYLKPANISALFCALLNLLFYTAETVLCQMTTDKITWEFLCINGLYLVGVLLFLRGQAKMSMAFALPGAFCALGAFWWTMFLPADLALTLLRSDMAFLQSAGLPVSADVIQTVELVLPILTLATAAYDTRFFMKKPEMVRFSDVDVPPDSGKK